MPIPETRASLILRLPTVADAEAWREFASIYEPFVYRFGRRSGLQDADARELVQNVKLLRKQLERRKTARDEIISLRLKTIVNNADGLDFPGDEDPSDGSSLFGPASSNRTVPVPIDNPNELTSRR